MKKYVYCFKILFVFLLFSCEGETKVDVYLQNNSSDTLTVKYFSTYDSLVYDLLPGGTTVLTERTYLGGNANPGSIKLYLDSVAILSQGNLIQKKMREDSSWQVVTEHTRKIPSIYTHHFVSSVDSIDVILIP